VSNDEPGLLARLLGERFGQRHAESERITRTDTPEQVAQRRRVLTGADQKDVKRRT
jgi:hypothetical protein